MSEQMKCQDCLKPIAEAGCLWTAPNGELVCTACAEMRGLRPKGLRELNEERSRARKEPKAVR